MKILICILTLLFSELAYSKSFSILKFEITGNKQASNAIKVINKALKAKEIYSWSNTFDENAKIMLNGVAVQEVSVSDGEVVKFLTKEDVEIGKLFVPAPAIFSFMVKSNVEVYSYSENFQIRYDGLVLRKSATINISRNGKVFTAVSGKFQNYNGITYFENDVLLGDKDGKLTALKEVRHFGKKYNLRDYQRNNIIPLRRLRVSRIEIGVYLVLGFTDKNEYFGNKCKHCEYTLCQKDDHFYVYMIRSIDYKNDIFQGKPIKDKFQQEQYFKYGDSTTPVVRNINDDEPFQNICSFEPFKA